MAGRVKDNERGWVRKEVKKVKKRIKIDIVFFLVTTAHIIRSSRHFCELEEPHEEDHVQDGTGYERDEGVAMQNCKRRTTESMSHTQTPHSGLYSTQGGGEDTCIYMYNSWSEIFAEQACLLKLSVATTSICT